MLDLWTARRSNSIELTPIFYSFARLTMQELKIYVIQEFSECTHAPTRKQTNNQHTWLFVQERLANLVIEDDSPLDQSLNDSPPAKRSRSQNQDTPKVNSSVPINCQKGRGFGSGRIRSFFSGSGFGSLPPIDMRQTPASYVMLD